MALEITKENSVSPPKYLLSKKEISEQEFNTMLNNNDEQITQSSHQDKSLSFSSKHNINNANDNVKHIKYNSDTNRPNDNKASSKRIDNEENHSNEMKPNYLPKKEMFQRKTKDNYSKAISEYKTQVESATKQESQMMDLEFNKKKHENYDELYYECKANEKNQKEKILEEKMKERLEIQIKKDLNKSEYDKVVDKIRREVQQEIAKDFIQKKQKEIEHIKKKIEYSTQVKLLEYEKQLMQQYKDSFEKEKKKIIEEKEKKLKAVYKNKLVQMKERSKRDLNEKYTVMNNDLIREVDNMKNQYTIQSEKERKRLAKLNEMQFSCLQDEIKHKEKNKEINDLLTACKRTDCNNSLMKQTECDRPQTIMRKCNSRSNIPTRNMIMNINNSDMTHINQCKNDKSVNLFEVNKRIRYNSPKDELQMMNTNSNTNINKDDINKNKRDEYNHFLF